MTAPKGNRFWEARSSHGAKPKFADDPKELEGAKTASEKLWAACVEYFEWVEDNPLLSSELVKFQGAATKAMLPKMRAMTLKGLCRFIDISFETWTTWRSDRQDLSDIITRVEEVVFEQKLTGAAADMLNSNIIARELGLGDKVDNVSSDGSMTPQVTQYQLPSNGRDKDT